MSFGFTAATWVAIGTAAVGAASAAASADSQRKSAHQQQDAINAAQSQDAIDTASAKTQAALSANQKLSSDKRARQANVLALGGNGDTLGGGPTAANSVLSQGAGAGSAAQRAAASVLGGGAPTVSAGSYGTGRSGIGTKILPGSAAAY